MSAATAPIGPFVGINNRLPDHQLGLVERGQKAGDRYSLRYDQLLAFAVRGLAERIARLEGQNDSA